MQGTFRGAQGGIREQGKQQTSVSRSIWVQHTQSRESAGATTATDSCCALPQPHLALDERFRTDGCLQLLHLLGGAGDERGARVHDGLAAPLTQSQPVGNVHPRERCPERRQHLTDVPA